MNEDLLHIIKTPCFVINKEDLDNNLRSILRSINNFWTDPIVGYSFKTNSLPWLLSYLNGQGLFAEVVSSVEYDLAIRMGFSPNKIIYNGPIKDENSLLTAIKSGSFVNIDSKQELEYLKKHDAEFDQLYGIGVRVNVDLESFCPGQTIMGDNGGRFGFCDDTGELNNCIENIRKLRNLKINCLHMHTNSKTRSLEVFASITEYACKIIKKYKIDAQYLDIGGGFFGGPDATVSFHDYFHSIKAVLHRYELDNIQLIVEPGSSIIASSVDYICSVWDIKSTNYSRYAILDGSRTNIDPMKHKASYKYSVLTNNKTIIEKQVLAGSTCMEDDRFMTIQNEKQLVIGDKVIFKQVGSYTMALSPLFISYFPKVYLYQEGVYNLIREQWGNEEFIQKNFTFPISEENVVS